MHQNAQKSAVRREYLLERDRAFADRSFAEGPYRSKMRPFVPAAADSLAASDVSPGTWWTFASRETRSPPSETYEMRNSSELVDAATDEGPSSLSSTTRGLRETGTERRFPRFRLDPCTSRSGRFSSPELAGNHGSRGVLIRKYAFSVLAVAGVLSTMALPCQAFAQDPTPETSEATASGTTSGTTRSSSGRKKISLDDEFLVEGKLEKPSAFFVFKRSALDYDWARLDAQFTPLVLESVQDPLF